MGLLETFQNAIYGARDWPPSPVEARWEEIEKYRTRHRNNLAEMLAQTPYVSASWERTQAYTPVPLVAEVARFSADLMFSAPAKITLEGQEQPLEALLDVNKVDPFWQECAGTVAVEGRGAIRVILDEDVSPLPLLTYVNEDQILWDERHGRFVQGGIVVIERETTGLKGGDVYRLLEEHRKGTITRRLYRGKSHYLGSEVKLSTYPEFDGMADFEETGLDSPTLIRWDNVPGGHSDIRGMDVLLDRINEEFSRGTTKSRASNPITFGHRSLADKNGRINTDGLILVGGDEQIMPELGSKPSSLPIETVQPSMQADEQIAWTDYLIDSSLMFMGYSKASYGRDSGGAVESGTALRQKQARTLLTKSGKDRMSRETITQAIAVALAWSQRAPVVNDFRPEVELGDGLPRDTKEDSAEVKTLRDAGAISVEESVRTMNPGWSENAITEEVSRIEGEISTPNPMDQLFNNSLQ